MAEDVNECPAARFEPARHLAQQRLQPRGLNSAAGFRVCVWLTLSVCYNTKEALQATGLNFLMV